MAIIVGGGVMANVQLAEQFFLMSHDQISGRPLVSIERVECGLVGAMFGELIIDGRLGIKDGFIVVLDREPIDGDLADNSAAQAGAAYVYVRLAGAWTYAMYLKATNTDAGDTFGQALSDRIVGPAFFGDAKDFTADRMNLFIRHSMIDQLTFDPTRGSTNQLSADGPVILTAP
jgi:hypothetical protein